MENRYVGDIGDFGKYGLLRALCGDDLSLGVVWYLFPDETHNGDGGHVAYLSPLEEEPSARNRRCFRECDPPLYDGLRRIVRSGERNVRSVREGGILLPNTASYEEPLSFEDMPGNGPAAKEARLEHRSAWVRGALEATQGCDVVFVDPDNGLEVKTPRHHKKGPKWAFYDELSPYLDRRQSLVIYQQMNRGLTVDEQMRERFIQINDRLGRRVFALRYWRGMARAFFVLPSEAHEDVLHERARLFTQDPCWSEHFTLVEAERTGERR